MVPVPSIEFISQLSKCVVPYNLELNPARAGETPIIELYCALDPCVSMKQTLHSTEGDDKAQVSDWKLYSTDTGSVCGSIYVSQACHLSRSLSLDFAGDISLQKLFHGKEAMEWGAGT